MVSVYRGTTMGAYGDIEDDNSTALYTGVLIAIGQRSRRSQPSEEQTPRVVRRYHGSANINTDIRKGDRLLDQHGRWYNVDVTDVAPEIPGIIPDLEIELRSSDEGTVVNSHYLP